MACVEILGATHGHGVCAELRPGVGSAWWRLQNDTEKTEFRSVETCVANDAALGENIVIPTNMAKATTMNGAVAIRPRPR